MKHTDDERIRQSIADACAEALAGLSDGEIRELSWFFKNSSAKSERTEPMKQAA